MARAFLSYKSEHGEAVEDIGRRLVEAGIEVWLDRWHLKDGHPFQPQIETALQSCDCCAVFIGPGGFGPWHEEEMRFAIERRVRSRNEFRILPVLLPRTDRPDRSLIPPFLAALPWIEFQHTLADEAVFQRLVRGMRGQERGPTSSATIDSTICPYRSLETFHEEHAPYFFGREALSQWLLDHLRPKQETRAENRFLAIVGPSGSGKSSVARAGLLPLLRRGDIDGSESWPILVCRPGPDPIESLATSLAYNDVTRTALSAIPALIGGRADSFYECLLKDERTLHLAVRIALHGTPAPSRAVILVDQFEEIFTDTSIDAARSSAISNLLYASSVPSGQTIVLITLRADFYGQCAANAPLASAVSRHQELVGPMNAQELRRAIEMPAARVGCEFEPGLSQILVEAMDQESGALPLLQYTLAELWSHRDSRTLTISTYCNIGEVRGCLRRRAEDVFNRFSPSEQEICRRIFLRLIKPGEDTADTKLRACKDELGAASEITPLLSNLVDARLLTVLGEPESPNKQFVEISHEALIRAWPRLQTWIDESRDLLLLRHRLTQAAREWDAKNRDPSFLFRGAKLLQTEELANKCNDEMSPLEREFLTAARSEEDIFSWYTIGMQSIRDGVVVLREDSQILWANDNFSQWVTNEPHEVRGQNFYTVLGCPEILGPDFCPLQTALATGAWSQSTLRLSEGRYCQIRATPVSNRGSGSEQWLLVTVRDSAAEILHQQKLAAIHQAGNELADLAPADVANLDFGERVRLLKESIVLCMQDVLHLDVIDIRILDAETRELMPLMSVGIEPMAAQRRLFAGDRGNDIVGYVAATGKSYICGNVYEDPLYIDGAMGSRSSLTVPLILRDEVVGTLKVESPDIDAFTDSDLQFLEVFARNVSVAIKTLELLRSQAGTPSAAAVATIRGQVEVQVDDILSSAVDVLEKSTSKEPLLVLGLQRILRDAREIRRVIHESKTAETKGECIENEPRPLLNGRRILVVDSDRSVHSTARQWLEPYHCVIDIADNGVEALSLVQHLGPDFRYDAILSDIRLADMSGHELLLQLKKVMDYVPMILMTAFGYDSDQTIVKIRRDGVRFVVYKPFRVDRLVDAIEQTVDRRESD